MFSILNSGRGIWLWRITLPQGIQSEMSRCNLGSKVAQSSETAKGNNVGMKSWHSLFFLHQQKTPKNLNSALEIKPAIPRPNTKGLCWCTVLTSKLCWGATCRDERKSNLLISAGASPPTRHTCLVCGAPIRLGSPREVSEAPLAPALTVCGGCSFGSG